METDQWLTGWRAIGKYFGKSARTVQRYARDDGMPFFCDPSGRPMAMKSHLDAHILKMNQYNYNTKNWPDKGIGKALGYENEKAQQKKDLNERLILAQKPTRSRF
ncbi:MAG: hypothetical protein CVU51_00810 [Deltaproteobacteria bacterium HGW-Deltaproteobacteria-1]|jgi:hypothetical protein|nr:MAG: hypothetical protein CVU51_00810 [Deltaproteobacteria bacterium HGW-Deltaproteobacteria-1]